MNHCCDVTIVSARYFFILFLNVFQRRVYCFQLQDLENLTLRHDFLDTAYTILFRTNLWLCPLLCLFLFYSLRLFLYATTYLKELWHSLSLAGILSYHIGHSKSLPCELSHITQSHHVSWSMFSPCTLFQPPPGTLTLSCLLL